MDIKDILDTLGLDLTNPDARRGAIEAVQAILGSRTPPPESIDGELGVPTPPNGIDVELDPDLIMPSQKHNQPSSNDDIEIEDEEEILSQIKHNDPEDMLNNDGNSSGDDTDSDSEDSSNSSSSSSEMSSDDGAEPEKDSEDTSSSGKGDGDNDTNSSGEGESDEEEFDDDGSDGDDIVSETDDANSDDGGEESVESDEEAIDDDTGDGEWVEADEESEKDLIDTESDSEYEPDDKENEEVVDDEELEPDEFEFDEDDLLDDEIKNAYDDQEIKSKHEARKIKRERTLTAAKKALADAQTRNVAPSLIRELEKSIEALESLVEAAQKNLKDISDEEFNRMINRVFDAISAVGDKDLTFTTDEDRKLRAQEIKSDMESRETKQALSDEDIAAIRAETQAVKAREKETQQYRRPASGSFKGFREFLNSLQRAIALQIQTNEVQDDTWSAINRRYSGTGVLKQGQRKNDLPDQKIPIIDFYFDQSGSWSESDIAVGKKAIESLVDMEEKGQIKINIYYFSNHVFNDADSARNEGGTQAWNEIVKNVISTQATNVIIMTDSDMDDWWEGSRSGEPALKYVVPGYVWYLWRDGSNAPRLPRDLKGRAGVQQFSFSYGDV